MVSRQAEESNLPSQYILKHWDMRNLSNCNNTIEHLGVNLAVGPDKFGQMEELTNKLNT
jgi:hypothetical protein